MKKKLFAVVSAALACGLLFSFTARAENAKSIAVVLSTKGKVETKKEGTDWKDLKFGAVLDAGDRVRTGDESFAAIVFTDDKSQLKLRPDTEITVNADRRKDYSLSKKVNLELGELFAEVKKQKGSLQISTPTAVASVKGTKFWVIVLPGGETQQLTLEGVVELLSRSTGERVDVAAGWMGSVNADGEIEHSSLDAAMVPELPAEGEAQRIEMRFIDENGNEKTLIIEYQVEGE